MITIKQLTDISVEKIHAAFAKAFADYIEPFTLTCDQLQYMIERRGFNPELSFGAFDGDELIGFTLNGTGNWHGKRTAYDTGTGLVKAYRKQGIATRMFKESLPVLREHGFEQYLLEVIRTNTAAYDLYKKAGFEVTRKLDYYITTPNLIFAYAKLLDNDVMIKELESPDWKLFSTFWDFEPSWQNSIDSIQRKMDFFTLLGIFVDDSLAGYGLIERHSGDIPHLAIAKQHRRTGLATILIQHILPYSTNNTIQIINANADDKPFREFASSLGLKPGHGQYEMVMQL